MDSDATAITTALKALVSREVGFGYADLEMAQSQGAGQSGGPATVARLREFAAGRCALDRAMSALGLPTRHIPAAPDRGPLWPAGLVGAITHSGKHALAVVTTRRTHAGVGIDLVAPADWPEADLCPLFLQPAEYSGISRSEAAKRLAAKEAAIKLLRDATGTTYGFLDLIVTFGSDGRSFSVSAKGDSAPLNAKAALPVLGTVIVVAGHALAFCATGPVASSCVKGLAAS